MKRTAFLLVLVVVAGVWYLWSNQSPDQPPTPTTHEQAPPPERVRPELTEAKPAYPHARRPRLPQPSEPAAESSPSAPIERVDFDRRPWDPEREQKYQYDARAEVIEAFDRFVAETDLSDERVRGLLMLLYDFQETVKLLDAEFESHRPYRHEWHFDYLLRKKSADWRTVVFHTSEQLYDMLSEEEMRAWRRNVADTSIWLKLSSNRIIGSLIRPVEAP